MKRNKIYLLVLLVIIPSLLLTIYIFFNSVHEARQSNSLHDFLTSHFSELIGRPVSVSVSQENSIDNWIFTYGKLTEINGEPLDYSTTNYKKPFDRGLIDDWFCSLTNKKSNYTVVEYCLGDTDTPYIEWIDKYKLPDELFDD